VEGLTTTEPVGAATPDDTLATPAAGGILLRLGGSRYVVAMADVAEVIPVPEVTRIPGAPVWLTGVGNWRGRMLAVLDIRSLLGAATTPLSTSARLVVLRSGLITAAVVAEAVPGVYDVSMDHPAPAPPTLSADAARLVTGQVEDELGPIGVLDLEAVLGLRDRVDRRRHGG
jgi:chemotaxis signal transduction protein